MYIYIICILLNKTCFRLCLKTCSSKMKYIGSSTFVSKLNDDEFWAFEVCSSLCPEFSNIIIADLKFSPVSAGSVRSATFGMFRDLSDTRWGSR